MINRVGFVEPLENRVLLAAGDPDVTFNNGSPATINFPGGSFLIRDTAIQLDGKVVAVGTKAGGVAVTRFNVNGSIDTLFANQGLYESASRPSAVAVVTQGDGKIVVSLQADDSSEDPYPRVIRLNGNGTVDTSFSFDGEVTFGSTHISALAIQQDGKILVAGYDHDAVDNDDDFWFYRLTSQGLPDPDFTQNIEIGFGENERLAAITIDYNGTPVTNPLYGTIVAVGDKRSSQSDPSTRFTICRLLPSGMLDDTFDFDGKMTSPDLSPQPSEYATGVQIQSGGKIVVTGTALAIGGGNETGDFLLARYLSNGEIDPSFGPFGTGIVQTDFGFDDQAVDSAPGFLDGFLVSGQSSSAGAVAAYTRDGLFDTRFSGDGYLRITSFVGSVRVATSGKTIAPIRRLVIGSGSRVGRYFDVGSLVSIRSFDHESAEAGQDPASFFVLRTEPLETTERVYISVGGTSRPSYLLNADYTVSGMTLVHPITGRSYIDIPPGETVAAATITPIDDASPEGDETIVLSISSDDAYDVSSLSPSTTLVIRDNDVVGGPTVASSSFVYDSGPPQRVRFTFSQDVGASIGGDDLSVSGPSGPIPFSFAYDNISNTATMSFGAILSDGNYTARAIAAGITNNSGQPMAADGLLSFFVLNGDANRDGSVNSDDFNILATNFGLSGKTFSEGNFDYDPPGLVNSDDFNILATKFGISIGAGDVVRAGGGVDQRSLFGQNRISASRRADEDAFSSLLA
jgi:uncharacterized delta-60 repeat protein